MLDIEFRTAFLGENLPWSRLSQALTDAPTVSLQLCRMDSLADLFQALADGRAHAVILDVHAWNFQGLHFVEKIRSEYPALPIVALYSPAVPELDAKAITSGASRCLSLDHLTADALYRAVAASFTDAKSQSHVYQSAPAARALNNSNSTSFPFSKTQVITHALNNLLCVITANADILADQIEDSASSARSLSEIRKAAQSAAALMRHLK